MPKSTNLPTVGFVILTWNSESVINSCLDSILDCKKDIIPIISIIENGSSDKTPEILRNYEEKFSKENIKHKIFYETENLGTTKSRNKGIHYLQSQKPNYICILDSDTVVNPKAIKNLINALENNPTIGIVGPKMTNRKNQIQQSARKFPTLTLKLMKAIPIKSVQQKGEQQEKYIFSKKSEIYPVEYLLSACWLLPSSILEKVGTLDEKIFYAPEDVDYCLRVWKSGFKCCFVPASEIIHEYQRLSKKQLLSKHNFEHVKGLAYYFKKHHYLWNTKNIAKTINSSKTSPMRIMHIGLYDSLGGIETCVMNYYRHINRDEIQFDFTNPYDKLCFSDEIENLGGKIYNVANFKKHPLKYYRELIKILPNYKIVHIHMLSAANILPVLAAKTAKVPHIIVHSHNSDTPNGIIRKTLDNANRKILLKNATNFFACSNLAGKWLFGDNINFTVIPNAIDIKKFKFNPAVRKKIREDLRIDGKFVVGHVGRFSEQKNHAFLIDIFNEIHKEQPNSILMLIGSGELKDNIKEKVESLNLDDSVLFLGNKDNIHDYYQAMDVFVLPSLFEGLPIVGIEAQMSRLLCFFSNSITPEVKIANSASFLPSNESPMQWSKAILQANNPQRNFTLSPGYDILEQSKRLLKLYDKITKKAHK